MANRRLGGIGGGPQRGNRSFSQHQPFQRNNVSPWQGNMPSNNSMNQGGLLGQLTTNPQQAQQLALALTNLLQPQQQQMNNPPSLLSLNTSPAFSHQDSRDSFNRFGNRARSDFRRNEPYNNNKHRNGGWRQLDSSKLSGGNRNRNFGGGPRGGDNRKQNRPKFVNKDDKDKQNKNIKVEKKEEPQPEQQKDEKEKDSNNIVSEDNRDDEANEETKRDWKEEKNNAEETSTKKDEEQVEGVKDNADKSKSSATVPESSNKDLEGKYHGVPTKYLHCFVCNKDMWDGESFQKHIRGHAHKQMLQSLEESFHITVNILRENMRLSEEKKVIELNRMHRLSRNKYNRKFQEPESHCNMCDLKFLGKIITHRKTEGHQRLKRFLHPNCDICSKEFPSRMDWVDHRLTPEHLRQLSEVLSKKAGNEDGEVIEQDLEMDLEPLLEESIEMEEEHPIVELTDELNNFQNRMPAYKSSRPVGTLCLKSFTGFMCEICKKSFEKEALAQDHLKTKGHYFNFVEAVKLKFKKMSEEQAEKEAENKKRKREENEESEQKDANETEKEEPMGAENGASEMYDPEEACNEQEYAVDIDGDPNNLVVGGSAEQEVEEEDVKEKEEMNESTDSVGNNTSNTGRVTRRGMLKNGPGTRGKKLSTIKPGGKAETSGLLSTFRIPKIRRFGKTGPDRNYFK